MPQPSPDLSGLRGKRLLIFDDGLRGKDGHWFEYDKAVAEAHAGLGVATTVVSHANFDDAAQLEAPDVRVVRLIQRSLWTGWMAGAAGLIGEAIVILGLARNFAAVLRRMLREQSYHCIFHPSAMAADVLAWSLVPRRLRRRAGRIVLLTRFGLGEYGVNGPPRYARKLRYWRWLMARLERDRAQGRLALITDSSRLADEYETVSGIRPTVIGSPRAPASAGRNERSDVLTFATLGAARLEKGIDVFQQAIERVLSEEQAARARFLLQWNRPVPTPDGGTYARSAALETNPTVEFVDRVLSSEDYLRLLGETDCMVLPYRRSYYYSQISGVAVEAACAGIPVIYTADTWLSDFIAEQGAGIAVADGDADGLARAILEMEAHYPHYRREAVARSIEARERNSPERFVQTLWGLAG